MDLARIRPVYDHPGPFATVYLEGRSPGEDAPQQVRRGAGRRTSTRPTPAASVSSKAAAPRESTSLAAGRSPTSRCNAAPTKRSSRTLKTSLLTSRAASRFDPGVLVLAGEIQGRTAIRNELPDDPAIDRAAVVAQAAEMGAGGTLLFQHNQPASDEYADEAALLRAAAVGGADVQQVDSEIAEGVAAMLRFPIDDDNPERTHHDRSR